MLAGLHHDIPNDAYHAETDWLSSSQLKALMPEHYKAGGSQEALDFGTLFHTAVLEPDDLDGYVSLDAEKVGVKADGSPAQNPTMTAAWKRAVAEAEADGKTVIDHADLRRVMRMQKAILDHDIANDLLFKREGSNEVSAFSDVDGHPCKARFDRQISGAIVDLKSTSAKPGARSLGYAIRDYGYDLSAAHYMDVAHALDLDVQAFVLVFVGKEPPHYVTVVDLSDQTISRGRDMRQHAINRHLGLEDAYEGATGFITI